MYISFQNDESQLKICSWTVIILLEIFCFYNLHFMTQKWKTTFLFHTSAELLLEYPPLVFLPGKTKGTGYMQPKRFFNFNPSRHFFQVNMKRTRKKHSQPPLVSFSSLQVSFQSSAVVDSRSQRDASPEFVSS